MGKFCRVVADLGIVADSNNTDWQHYYRWCSGIVVDEIVVVAVDATVNEDSNTDWQH